MPKKITLTEKHKIYLSDSDNYKNLTLKEMSKEIGFSSTIVERFFRENNIERGLKLIWTEGMFNYLKYNYRCKDYKDIATYINKNLNPNKKVTRKSIESKLYNERIYKFYKVRKKNEKKWMD